MNEKENDKFTVLKIVQGAIGSIRLNDSGSLLVIATNDGEITLLNTMTRKIVFQVTPFSFDMYANSANAEFSSNEDWLMVYFFARKKIAVIDAIDGRVIKEYENIDFDNISFSRDTSLIALGKEKTNEIEIRNILTWKLVCSIHTSEKNYNLRLSREGNLLATELIGIEKLLKLWDVKKCKEKKSIPFIHQIDSIEFLDKERYLSGGYGRGMAFLYDLTKNEFEKIWLAHSSSVQQIMFSPDGKYIATSGYDSHVNIWDRKTFQFLKQIHHTGNAGNQYAKDSKGIYMYSGNSLIIYWDLTREEFYKNRGVAR